MELAGGGLDGEFSQGFARFGDGDEGGDVEVLGYGCSASALDDCCYGGCHCFRVFVRMEMPAMCGDDDSNSGCTHDESMQGRQEGDGELVLYSETVTVIVSYFVDVHCSFERDVIS